MALCSLRGKLNEGESPEVFGSEPGKNSCSDVRGVLESSSSMEEAEEIEESDESEEEVEDSDEREDTEEGDDTIEEISNDTVGSIGGGVEGR